VLRSLTAILTAAVLALVVVWFYLEFGWCVALFALASMALSEWLTVFSPNLWWSTWAFYLPMVVMMHVLRRDRVDTASHILRNSILVFVLVLVKCLINGCEFITTALLMTLTPFIYEGVRLPVGARAFSKRFLTASTGACLAVAFSLLVLSFQIASARGSLRDGFHHVVHSFKKRTHSDPGGFPPAYRGSLESNTLPVVQTYLEGVYLNLGKYQWIPRAVASRVPLRIRYDFLAAIFLAASIALGFENNRWGSEEGRRRGQALVVATWFAFLAPLSWYIVFKGHSYIHTGLNFVLWQMPFTIFGFAVCGLAIRGLLKGTTIRPPL
jgi:hypothetical protein